MKSKTMILSVLIVFSMSIAYANPSKAGCEEKKKTLEKQLKYAKNDKDKRLIAGLTRTLESLNATCEWERRLKNLQEQTPVHQSNSASDIPSNKVNSSKNSRSHSKYKTKNKTKKVQAKKKY
ncbi:MULTISPECIES: DUF1090 family protein [Xenorhabdus]|uniref:DUF1090 family protein n=1 Tax=Xenorhabdus TaxID=626 RepID=UPI000645F289|nr:MULTISPECIES: DUF1090 family protein [Xenorhabdus]MBC8943973.1 hypothetical protein [Xenorhabdus indica]